MKIDIKKRISIPFIHFKNNIVIKINNELEKLIGYSKEELSGKSIEYINSILKLNSQKSLKNIACCSKVHSFRSYDVRKSNA